MKRIGVLGWPIAHSLSPGMHAAGFAARSMSARYDALAVTPDRLSSELAACLEDGYVGLNVTRPHKEAVLAACREVSPAAAAIGAANTLVRVDGGWRAENTDGDGFMMTLDAPVGRALVLGSGGAARAVGRALAASGTRVLLAARREASRKAVCQALGLIAVDWAARHEALGGVDLVVNATPIGQNDGASPLESLDAAHEGTLVYDLVYAPPVTPLLEAARRRGLAVRGGLGMLAAQGALSWRPWFGETGPVDVFLAYLESRVKEGGA